MEVLYLYLLCRPAGSCSFGSVCLSLVHDIRLAWGGFLKHSIRPCVLVGHGVVCVFL